MKFGAFELDILSDGTFALDGGQMFGVVPKVLWEKQAPADARNRICLGLNCVLVRTGRQTIVIETGIGDKYDSKFANIYDIRRTQTLPEALRARGVALEDVDIVINSHLHFDHCGWNTRRDAGNVVPTFPRAKYFVQRGEWEHAMRPSERDRASYIREYFEACEKRTEFVSGEAEIIPGFRVEVMSGHNRDLQCIHVESEGARACFISDLVPTRAHLPYPWIMSFDLYPLETLANRRRLLPQLAEQKALVIFPHDADLPCARLSEQDGRITAVAVE